MRIQSSQPVTTSQKASVPAIGKVTLPNNQLAEVMSWPGLSKLEEMAELAKAIRQIVSQSDEQLRIR